MKFTNEGVHANATATSDSQNNFKKKTNHPINPMVCVPLFRGFWNPDKYSCNRPHKVVKGRH